MSAECLTLNVQADLGLEVKGAIQVTEADLLEYQINRKGRMVDALKTLVQQTINLQVSVKYDELQVLISGKDYEDFRRRREEARREEAYLPVDGYELDLWTEVHNATTADGIIDPLKKLYELLWVTIDENPQFSGDRRQDLYDNHNALGAILYADTYSKMTFIALKENLGRFSRYLRVYPPGHGC